MSNIQIYRNVRKHLKKRNWDRENMGKGRQDVRKMSREECVEVGKPPPQSKKEDVKF